MSRTTQSRGQKGARVVYEPDGTSTTIFGRGKSDMNKMFTHINEETGTTMRFWATKLSGKVSKLVFNDFSKDIKYEAEFGVRSGAEDDQDSSSSQQSSSSDQSSESSDRQSSSSSSNRTRGRGGSSRHRRDPRPSNLRSNWHQTDYTRKKADKFTADKFDDWKKNRDLTTVADAIHIATNLADDVHAQGGEISANRAAYAGCMLGEVESGLTKDTTKKHIEKVDKKLTRLTNTIYEKASLKEGPGDRFWDALSRRADKPPVKSDCLYTYLDGSQIYANKDFSFKPGDYNTWLKKDAATRNSRYTSAVHWTNSLAGALGAPPGGKGEQWVEKLAFAGARLSELPTEKTSVLEGEIASLMRSEKYSNKRCRSVRRELSTIRSKVKSLNDNPSPSLDRQGIYTNLRLLEFPEAPSRSDSSDTGSGGSSYEEQSSSESNSRSSMDTNTAHTRANTRRNERGPDRGRSRDNRSRRPRRDHSRDYIDDRSERGYDRGRSRDRDDNRSRRSHRNRSRDYDDRSPPPRRDRSRDRDDNRSRRSHRNRSRDYDDRSPPPRRDRSRAHSHRSRSPHIMWAEPSSPRRSSHDRTRRHSATRTSRDDRSKPSRSHRHTKSSRNKSERK